MVWFDVLTDPFLYSFNQIKKVAKYIQIFEMANIQVNFCTQSFQP